MCFALLINLIYRFWAKALSFFVSFIPALKGGAIHWAKALCLSVLYSSSSS
jgi:hypothetical protein